MIVAKLKEKHEFASNIFLIEFGAFGPQSLHKIHGEHFRVKTQRSDAPSPKWATISSERSGKSPVNIHPLDVSPRSVLRPLRPLRHAVRGSFRTVGPRPVPSKGARSNLSSGLPRTLRQDVLGGCERLFRLVHCRRGCSCSRVKVTENPNAMQIKNLGVAMSFSRTAIYHQRGKNLDFFRSDSYTNTEAKVGLCKKGDI